MQEKMFTMNKKCMNRREYVYVYVCVCQHCYSKKQIVVSPVACQQRVEVRHVIIFED